MKKLNPGFKQFMLKILLFVAVFIIVSLIIGQKIVSSKLLYEFYIFIYGGMGYIFLFSIAGFVLLYRKKILEMKKYKFDKINLFFLLVFLVLVFLFYLIEINISKIAPNIFSIAVVHLIFLSMFISLIFGIFGPRFIRDFLKNFKKEIFYFLIFGILVYFLMNYVWKLWPYFSMIVLNAVAFMLKIISIDYSIVPPRTLYVGSFAATIAEACSGVYSIFIFTALYLFIVFLDWRKINKKKAALLFIPAVLGAFFVNILRVFVLFIAGAYVSREVALGLYHSYVGMVFFLIYFAIFWILFYSWMRNEKSKLFSDSLYSNSIFLFLSTIVMAFLGFIFWMINARLFSAEQVGLATALISVMNIIVSFSVLGLGSGLIRYLPKSERKNEKINTCFTLVGIVTIIISSIFLLSLSLISPKLLFIKQNIVLSLIFILFMVFASWNSLTESIFIAYRKSKYVLMKNSIFSVLKIIFPFALVSLGAYGIFASWTLAVMIGFIVSFFIIIFKLNYQPKLVFYDRIIKKIGKFSFGNYIAGFIAGLPAMILPLIILGKLSADISGFYYISLMMASVIFSIPNSVSNSLFAEGSYDEKSLSIYVKKAAKFISIFMVPAIILVLFFGNFILLLVGRNYSEGGLVFLKILAVSGIFISINSVFSSVFRVKKKIKEIVIISSIMAVSILGLSWAFIGQGLQGIGLAWIIGQAVASLCYLGFFIAWKRKKYY